MNTGQRAIELVSAAFESADLGRPARVLLKDDPIEAGVIDIQIYCQSQALEGEMFGPEENLARTTAARLALQTETGRHVEVVGDGVGMAILLKFHGDLAALESPSVEEIQVETRRLRSVIVALESEEEPE